MEWIPFFKKKVVFILLLLCCSNSDAVCCDGGVGVNKARKKRNTQYIENPWGLRGMWIFKVEAGF